MHYWYLSTQQIQLRKESSFRPSWRSRIGWPWQWEGVAGFLQKPWMGITFCYWFIQTSASWHHLKAPLASVAGICTFKTWAFEGHFRFKPQCKGTQFFGVHESPHSVKPWDSKVWTAGTPCYKGYFQVCLAFRHCQFFWSCSLHCANRNDIPNSAWELMGAPLGTHFVFKCSVCVYVDVKNGPPLGRLLEVILFLVCF